MSFVEIRDINNDFKVIDEIPTQLAYNLKAGDFFHPRATGFSFIIVSRVVCSDENFYVLRLNAKEYNPFWKKLLRIAFGIKPYSYWDFKKGQIKK
jgi:hypothetical protein